MLNNKDVDKIITLIEFIEHKNILKEAIDKEALILNCRGGNQNNFTIYQRLPRC
jgi:hypothetical protein